MCWKHHWCWWVSGLTRQMVSCSGWIMAYWKYYEINLSCAHSNLYSWPMGQSFILDPSDSIINKENYILPLQEKLKIAPIVEIQGYFMEIEMRMGKKAYESLNCQQESTSSSIFISFQSLCERKQEISIAISWARFWHVGPYEIWALPDPFYHSVSKKEHLRDGRKENLAHVAILLYRT